MIEYSKIETLYNRDEKTRKVIPGDFRCPEFDAVKYWHVTEKIDGTNVRVGIEDGKRVIGGRTNNAQMPVALVEALDQLLPLGKLERQFAREDGSLSEVVLFGEGYGPRIQKGGTYRSDISFILFDVWIDGWWLEYENVRDIAVKLGIEDVPAFCERATLEGAIEIFEATQMGSTLSRRHGKEGPCEGVVARSVPLMRTRRGERIMWKLKHRDY